VNDYQLRNLLHFSTAHLYFTHTHKQLSTQSFTYLLTSHTYTRQCIKKQPTVDNIYTDTHIKSSSDNSSTCNGKKATSLIWCIWARRTK